MATQLRIRSAKVLVVNLSAVGTEVVKNLVLGGVNSLEILDSSTVKEEDFLAQFFLPNDDSIIGQLKVPHAITQIRELNNRVKLTANTGVLLEMPREYFAQFDLVIATEISKQEMLAINKETRALNIPLYVAGMHGMFGYILTDLVRHESQLEKDIGNQPRVAGTKINRKKTITNVEYNPTTNKENVTIVDDFVILQDLLVSEELPKQLNKRQMKRLSAALPIIFSLFEVQRTLEDIDIELLRKLLLETAEKLKIPTSVITQEYLELFSRQAFAEFSPVAAVLGGSLAQDVIQFLSKKESPINNCLILDGIRSEMPIYLL